MKAGGDWDAIVVGGGVGGATCAAYLAAVGKRTLLLEQYDVVGGCSHVFRRKGVWEFDVGVHYLGDCGPGGQLPPVLRGLALEDRIGFEQMDPAGFDTILRPGLEVRVPRGWDNYLANLIEALPGDERALRRLFAVLQPLGESIDRSLTPASMLGAARFALAAGPAARWALRPLSSLLSACGLSDLAAGVVIAHCGAYAAPPDRAPVALHAGFLAAYVGGGAWFPRGGGQVFAANLVDVIHGHGGTVRTRARVERILVEDGRAVGVELGDGERIGAAAVVSGADLKKTYLDLVGREHLRRRTVRRVQGWRMAPPFVNLYLGVDVDLRGVIPNTNYYCSPNTADPRRMFTEGIGGGARPREEWLADVVENMPAFVHCSTVKDPTNPRCAPEGCSSLEVMAPVPSNHSLWSSASGDYRRDPTYLEMKKRLGEMLVSRAELAIPAIKGKVAWQEVATPLTQERYTLASGGACFGLEPSIGQFGLSRPRSRTEISGLYLTGTGTAWGPGIEGSMLSGVHAAGAVLDRDLAREIRRGAVLADPSCLGQQEDGWDPLLASKRLSRKPVLV